MRKNISLKALLNINSKRDLENVVNEYKIPAYDTKAFQDNYVKVEYVGLIEPHICQLCGKETAVFQGFFKKYVCHDSLLDNTAHLVRDTKLQGIPEKFKLVRLASLSTHCISCVEKELLCSKH
jgi:hypothetical protein